MKPLSTHQHIAAALGISQANGATSKRFVSQSEVMSDITVRYARSAINADKRKALRDLGGELKKIREILLPASAVSEIKYLLADLHAHYNEGDINKQQLAILGSQYVLAVNSIIDESVVFNSGRDDLKKFKDGVGAMMYHLNICADEDEISLQLIQDMAHKQELIKKQESRLNHGHFTDRNDPRTAMQPDQFL